MRFREFNPLRESLFSPKRKTSVAFKKSDVSDSHILKVIEKISLETGVPKEEIIKEMQEDIEKIKEIGQYSPILYGTILQNAAEEAAFSLINKSKFPVNKKEYTLDKDIFKQLLAIVKLDHPSFFPLKSKDKLRRITKILPIFVPSDKKEYKHWDYIKTAAISDRGDFIFNTDFLESLLYYGAAVDVQPKGVIYVCNGGTIPNNYCYIEFIIMHELMHWKAGDFFSSKKFKQYSHKAHNIGSDLRSNHLLVKYGYEQLPTGLFSGSINFSQKETNSYQKLMAVVDRELKKIPKKLQAWIVTHDEHKPPPPPPPPGQPPPPKEKWRPSPGQVLLNNKTGQFVMITKAHDNETYDGEVITKEKAEEILGKPIKVR